MKRTQNLVTREDGAMMVEYAIVLGFVALLLVGLIAQIGQIVLPFFQAANSF